MVWFGVSYYSRGSINKCKLKVINPPSWERRLTTHAPKRKAPVIEIILKNRIYPPLTPYDNMPHEVPKRKLDEIQTLTVIT